MFILKIWKKTLREVVSTFVVTIGCGVMAIAKLLTNVSVAIIKAAFAIKGIEYPSGKEIEEADHE